MGYEQSKTTGTATAKKAVQQKFVKLSPTFKPKVPKVNLKSKPGK